MLIRAALLAWVVWITSRSLRYIQKAPHPWGFFFTYIVREALDPDITPHPLTSQKDDAVVSGAGGFLYHRGIGRA